MTHIPYEIMDPEDIRGKVVVITYPGHATDIAQYFAEIQKVFPDIKHSQVLMMPPEHEIRASPREDIIAQLRGILKRLEAG